MNNWCIWKNNRACKFHANIITSKNIIRLRSITENYLLLWQSTTVTIIGAPKRDSMRSIAATLITAYTTLFISLIHVTSGVLCGAVVTKTFPFIDYADYQNHRLTNSTSSQ